MSNSIHLSFPEIIKLFDFLDSDTPAALSWSQYYLAGKGIQLMNTAISSQTVKIELARALLAMRWPTAEIKQLSHAMRNAWRVRKYRQKREVISLSICLSKPIADKLTRISKGTTKSEIISLLINEGYQDFLEQQTVIHKNKESQRQLAKELQERNKFGKMKLKYDYDAKQNNDLVHVIAVNEELKTQVALLYDLIVNSNTQALPIDEKSLRHATMLYFSCFNK